MKSRKKPRKRLFVDPKVQGALVLRAMLYWAVCLMTIMLMLLCWRIITGPARMFYTHLDDMWFHFGPALVASTLLLPLVILDMIRLSNRFAGPLLRLRRSMRALARGEHVEPIEVRDGDFWKDFADEFNAVAARVQAAAPAPEAHPAAEGEGSDELTEPVSAGAE
jgi:hypothetical protein